MTTSIRPTADELYWAAQDEARRLRAPERDKHARAYLADPAGRDGFCIACGNPADEGVVFSVDATDDETLLPHDRRAELAAVVLAPAGLVVPVCDRHHLVSVWPNVVRIALYDHLLGHRVSAAISPRRLAPGPSTAGVVVLTGTVPVEARDVTPRRAVHDCPDCRCGS